MAITKVKSSNIEDSLDLSGKTVTLPAASVTAHASPAPTLDSPVITGTLSVLDSSTVTHTIANWSDDLSYTITPTNCTAGAVNASGQFVITHTSGTPSYTIKATTASLGLGDSALVTKNITMQLTAPTLSSPADVGTATNVVYTITSTSTGDDKIILDPGTANFTYQSVSVGTASKVGNTVECIGFTTNNPAVTIQFTAEATYSVTATSVNIAGTYGTSANSTADSITINNYTTPVATGGTITTDGDYKVHTFTTSGTFQVTTVGADPELDYLVIAGGASGGGGVGGGGGSGGYRNTYASETSGGGGLSETQITSTVTSYTVTIGGGGAAVSGWGTAGGYGASGSNTVFGAITSTGGGGGGYYVNPGPINGVAGGSGGGSGACESSQGVGGAGTSNQGFAGGTSTGSAAGPYGGGGGGGGGAVGTNAPSTGGGNGGLGISSSISGSAVGRAGGGGGAGHTGDTYGTGTSGGGQGGSETVHDGGAGTVNTGGGGGGSSGATAGQGGHNSGAGGSGVVIIRYKFQ
jgi:hypothetical protein